MTGIVNSQPILGKETAGEVITAFLRKHKHLYEIRLQNLLYITELYTIQNYDTRFTDAAFTPNMHGATSTHIHETLHSLPLETDIVTRNGVKTRKYLSYGVPSQHLPETPEAIINAVHTRTRTTPTSELVTDAKTTWLHNHHENGDEMNFTNYYTEVVKPTARKHREYYNSDVNRTVTPTPNHN